MAWWAWLALVLGVAALAIVLQQRLRPQACPYGLRFFVEVPHPLITRPRLRTILGPAEGERVLEIGPGTGYYTLDLAEWVGPAGAVEIFDLQREMLDHTMRRVAERGLENVHDTQGDAQRLPYETDSFDAAVLITVLGEIPDQDAALREIKRVLKPGGRLVVGEMMLGDPHYVRLGTLQRRGQAAGLSLERHSGPKLGYFARLSA
jgi:SAM-dependent methyltransferase